MKPHFITPDQVGIRFDDIYISTNDNTQLHGWKLHADTDPVGTVLYFHGNAENISTHFGSVFWLTKQGYDVYLFDYRGYGQSEGEADLDLIIKDAERMISHVVDRQDVEDIIVIGQSLGASIAIYSVAHSQHKQDIAALVSVSAFSDYHDVTQDVLSKSWLLWLFQWPLSYTISNKYSPIESVGNVSPVNFLILQSTDDEIIEMYHAESLYKAAKEPKSLQLIDSNHSNVFVNSANRKLLLDYLSQLK